MTIADEVGFSAQDGSDTASVPRARSCVLVVGAVPISTLFDPEGTDVSRSIDKNFFGDITAAARGIAIAQSEVFHIQADITIKFLLNCGEAIRFL